MGEIFLESYGTCQECSEGKYSINATGTECFECESNAYCAGGDGLAPKKEYWRLDENSKGIIECPRAESCLGGAYSDSNDTVHGDCAFSYTGNLCASCEEGFVISVSNSECIRCGNDWLYHVQVVGLILLQVIIIIYGIKSTLNDLSGEQKDESSSSTETPLANQENSENNPIDIQNKPEQLASSEETGRSVGVTAYHLDDEDIQSIITKMFMNFATVSGLLMRGSIENISMVA